MIHGLRGRVPRLGKIRLGEKVEGRDGGPYPRPTNHFVVRADGITSEEAATAFREVYGNTPTEIDIMTVSDHTDEIIDVWYRCYSASGLVCKGDGETATRVSRETGEREQVRCEPKTCSYYQEKKCRRMAIIRFVLPRVRGLGVWEVDTTSWNSIRNIYGGVEFVKQLTGGRIAGLPLKLALGPQEVTADGRKKTVWVLSLKNDHVRMQDLLNAARRPIDGMPLLPEPDDTVPPDDLYPREVLDEPVGGAPEPTPASEPAAAPEPQGAPADEAAETRTAEIRRLARERGMTDAALILLLHRRYGIHSMHDLAPDQAADLIAHLSGGSKPEKTAASNGGEAPATEAQSRKLYALSREHGVDLKALLQERYGVESPRELSKRAASDLITRLSGPAFAAEVPAASDAPQNDLFGSIEPLEIIEV